VHGIESREIEYDSYNDRDSEYVKVSIISRASKLYSPSVFKALPSLAATSSRKPTLVSQENAVGRRA